MTIPDDSCAANNSKRAEEIERCVREIGFLEAILTRDPGQTHLWVLRSEIYLHLYLKFRLDNYTTEQMFFGAFVAGKSKEDTIKDAHSASFLALPHYKKLRDIAQDNTYDTDT